MTIKPAYLDLPSVAGYLALSESTVQKLVRLAEFPKPRQLSGHRVAWLVRRIRNLLAQLPDGGVRNFAESRRRSDAATCSTALYGDKNGN